METLDVAVLGSGASGLAAALAAHGHGASVVVFEKGLQLGGTSAWSGGMIWIPNNPHMQAAGIEDSREEALTYLTSLSHDLIDPALAEAFVDHGPEMVRWMEANTPAQFQLVPEFPDYHPEFPGGKPGGGRSLECPLFSYDELGEHRHRVTVGHNYGTAPVTMEESHLGRAVPVQVAAEERARRAQRDERGCGQALIGRLFKGCLDRDIEVRTQCRATDLVVRSGRVVGLRLQGPDGPFEVQVRGGVVLATGGFEWNQELVRAFLRGPMTSPVSVPTNEGDGLIMCMRIGAALGNMREAWWMPAVEAPGGADGRPQIHLFAAERARPRSIMVNRYGRRFTNEAANYNAFGAAFHEQDVARFDYPNLPCWFVFDQAHLDAYGFIDSAPGAPAANWIIKAASLRELAVRTGIDPDALASTVARWNRQVAAGKDEDFHRGESAHDTWWGDPQVKGCPEATLGPLDRGPFYAVEVKSGALGTKGGPKTDGCGRVVNVDGEVIDGLYAAGNVMASAMGMTYGGAGGTLAPGMVFGFLSGRDAAGRAQRAAREAVG
jgi:succinate dehydrogenase/fumarate reductase flavoprotein subunit